MKTNKIKNKECIQKTPNNSGIYWLYQKDKSGWNVVYIGISNNLNRRLKQHLIGKEFDGFYYETLPLDISKKREKKILQSYVDLRGKLPSLNRQIG